MILSVYCQACAKITEHAQFHDLDFNSDPNSHLMGTERFACSTCETAIYADEAWTFSLESAFVRDKTEHEPETLAYMLQEIATIRVMNTELMMTCKIAAHILAGRYERVFHPQVRTGAIKIEGGEAIFNMRGVRYVLQQNGGFDRYGSYMKGVCREAAMHLDRLLRAEIAHDHKQHHHPEV